jgi:hypothetical protein
MKYRIAIWAAGFLVANGSAVKENVQIQGSGDARA